ncbi:sigma-54-dependent Fis family transcriptional regulator [Polyangium sp. 6x1]|uniref:sigma-54-dependent Fis family transcriptional regulator n=1 Tax=Polyangium sp. 6x1 TaxID=3042689 RepID=UPI0024826DCE|nr:sigma-54-dependent Fis family transcriptional regulator [Polyangium sp. 6x1]MDI1449316.1 sigma-54-dependent Fis family transcriptional regulator [Polyangium sp. 6x1]
MGLPALRVRDEPSMVTTAAWHLMLELAPGSMSRLSLLVDLASLLAREVDLDALLGTACERLAQAMFADRATIWLVDAEQGDLVTRVALLPELPALRLPLGRGIAGYVARTGEVVRVGDASTDPRFDPTADRATGYTTRSMLVAPIREEARAPVRGVVQLLNKQGEGGFDEEDERYLVALASQLARALTMTTLRAADGGNPGLVLQGPFNRIVGRSAPITAVYEKIQLAAQTDATVLLRGETGTGKGLFARAIHVNSRRQARPFVTVDCTTLPAQLVESELFGHERGAFTGADRRVPGKVELAEGGTLFLDELGDLPLDIQGKLLRFLQDRTFERVGGRNTMRGDVRVVCATHRDLETAVAEGRFREDLYYRVRVVEIELPPLRTRGREEIEALTRHFADVYAQRYGRPSPTFDPAALLAIGSHTWPGNVRELEHWIESAIALAPDGRITPAHLPQRRRPTTISDGRSSEEEVRMPLHLSLDDAIERYVGAVVAVCDGNKTEAARRLGVGRNTIARALSRRHGGGPTSRGPDSLLGGTHGRGDDD